MCVRPRRRRDRRLPPPLRAFPNSRCLAQTSKLTAAAPAPDQSAFEPLFQSASAVLSNYRGLLGARTTVPDELARLGGTTESRPKPASPNTPVKKPTAKKQK